MCAFAAMAVRECGMRAARMEHVLSMLVYIVSEQK